MHTCIHACIHTYIYTFTHTGTYARIQWNKRDGKKMATHIGGGSVSFLRGCRLLGGGGGGGSSIGRPPVYRIDDVFRLSLFPGFLKPGFAFLPPMTVRLGSEPSLDLRRRFPNFPLPDWREGCLLVICEGGADIAECSCILRALATELSLPLRVVLLLPPSPPPRAATKADAAEATAETLVRVAGPSIRSYELVLAFPESRPEAELVGFDFDAAGIVVGGGSADARR